MASSERIHKSHGANSGKNEGKVRRDLLCVKGYSVLAFVSEHSLSPCLSISSFDAAGERAKCKFSQLAPNKVMGPLWRNKGGGDAAAAAGIFFDSPPLRILIQPAHEGQRRRARVAEAGAP